MNPDTVAVVVLWCCQRQQEVWHGGNVRRVHRTLGDCDHAIREGRALIQAALQVGVPEDAEPEFMEAAVDVLVTVGFGVAYFQRMRETLVDTTIANMERDLNN